MARLLFVVIPLALLALGASWVVSATNFWIATTGAPETLNKVAFVSTNEDFTVKVFYPEVIRNTDTDLKIEIEIEDNQQDSLFTNTLQVSVTDNCDYIKLDKTVHTFDMTSGALLQGGESLIVLRSNIPPSSCSFDVRVFDQDHEYGSTQFDIYINYWLGHLISFVGVIIGLIVSLASLRGALAVFGI